MDAKILIWDMAPNISQVFSLNNPVSPIWASYVFLDVGPFARALGHTLKKDRLFLPRSHCLFTALLEGEVL